MYDGGTILSGMVQQDIPLLGGTTGERHCQVMYIQQGYGANYISASTPFSTRFGDDENALPSRRDISNWLC